MKQSETQARLINFCQSIAYASEKVRTIRPYKLEYQKD